MMYRELSHITNTTPTPAGRVCRKEQGDNNGSKRLLYGYNPTNSPHAARRIYDPSTTNLRQMLWDANGNLAQQTVYSVNNNVPAYQNMRALFWDEDDRLNLVAGDGYLSYYAYGHDGNRAIKMTGNAAIDQTGMLLNSTNLENITIYPNEYLTVTQAEYTKYYYAGGNRIASKIGTGGFEKMTRLCTEDLFFSGNANTLFGSVILQVTNTANQPNDEYPVDVCSGYSVATELLINPLPTFYIAQTNLNFTQNNLLQQFRQNLAGGTEPDYYFHSDHLGSASWISDGTGAAVQHLQYLPLGEHFVNEHSSGYDERFTFTGKERDIETGYYYFGARFNSSDIGWLSVDPMADKYPSMSPYAYCAWNPVKLVDPEGREIWIAEDAYGNSKVSWNNGKLYNVDGSEYTGNNNFVLQTKNALDKINKHRNSSTILNKFVGETEYEITIIQGMDTEWRQTTTYSDIVGDGVSKYQTIKFNPNLGLYQCKNYDDEGSWLAPFVALFHEFGHIHDAITDLSAYNTRRNQEHDTYSNLEEMRIIQIYEWPLAKYYNMLKRDSHIEGVNGLEKFESENSTSIQRKK